MGEQRTPRLSFRSTAIPSLSITCAMISPSTTCSVKFFDPTTTRGFDEQLVGTLLPVRDSPFDPSKHLVRNYGHERSRHRAGQNVVVSAVAIPRNTKTRARPHRSPPRWWLSRWL